MLHTSQPLVCLLKKNHIVCNVLKYLDLLNQSVKYPGDIHACRQSKWTFMTYAGEQFSQIMPNTQMFKVNTVRTGVERQAKLLDMAAALVHIHLQKATTIKVW